MADIDPHLVESEDSSRVIKDVLAGTCGGIGLQAQVLTGQPFDTTKVRLQSAPEGKYSGALDVVKTLVKNEGFKGFYKGTLTPLIGVGACVSIQFGVNEFMKRYFHEQNKLKGVAGNHLSNSQFYLSGAAAGLANGFLAAPIEHIRIRLQTQGTGVQLYKGPIDCIRQIVHQGGVSGLFRGLMPTLIRESHGMGAYFWAFEAMVKREIKTHDIKRSDIPGWKLCLFGAMAGYAMWLTVYPIDVIKSKLQTDALRKQDQVYKSSYDCFKKSLKAQGVKGFFRGFLPTLLRAAPVNACTFYTFELAIRVLG